MTETQHIQKSPISTPLFDRPFVLSIGPQKAGTSWLDRYLRWRGDVCLPRDVKEIFFFDKNFARGPGFYASHFHPLPAQSCIVEITTTLFDCTLAPVRVYDTFGKDIHLLCPLRHPVARSFSLYRHFLRYGMAQGSLREAVRQAPQILESSRYGDHLERWYERFDRNSISLLFQEDLDNNQAGFVRNVCAILGLEHKEAGQDIQERFNVGTASSSPFMARAAQAGADWLRRNRLYGVVNAAKALGLKRVIFGADGPKPDSSEQMSAEEKDFLHEHVGEEAAKLERLIGRRVACWHGPSA